MKRKIKVVYWDSCVFLAWIKDEVRAPGEMAGVDAVVADIDAKRTILITSPVALTEIQEADLTTEAATKLRDIMNRSNVKTVAFSAEMGRRASELRSHYKKFPGPKLCFADAQHLATAIVYEVDEFHTFDGTDKKDCLGLLPLNGNVAGYPLPIIKPQSSAPVLDLRPGRKKP